MKLVFLTVILLLPFGKLWAVTAKLSSSKDLNTAAFGIVNFWCKEVIRGSHPSCANVATRHELVEAY